MTPTLSTLGLVLHTTQYAETSVIVKIFTRQLGVRSYIVKGVRKGKSRTKQNLLQPLSYLELVVYNNPKSSLNYIKEMVPYNSSHIKDMDMGMQAINNALRFFMTELLYKTLREEEPMPDLFDYVADVAYCQSPSPGLPIAFMITVARYMGIEPLDNYSMREPLFDLDGGRFCFSGNSTLDRECSQLLHYYLQSVSSDEVEPLAPLQLRTELINSLLSYFQLHLTEFRGFRSHEILHTVLQ
ncbi:MAG: DNA repair protein RecO [Bacteroidales bacterium]|nr:DNA repair protein RecO [Bacteroidales bacterium]